MAYNYGGYLRAVFNDYMRHLSTRAARIFNSLARFRLSTNAINFMNRDRLIGILEHDANFSRELDRLYERLFIQEEPEYTNILRLAALHRHEIVPFFQTFYRSMGREIGDLDQSALCLFIIELMCANGSPSFNTGPYTAVELTNAINNACYRPRNAGLNENFYTGPPLNAAAAPPPPTRFATSAGPSYRPRRSGTKKYKKRRTLKTRN